MMYCFVSNYNCCCHSLHVAVVVFVWTILKPPTVVLFINVMLQPLMLCRVCITLQTLHFENGRQPRKYATSDASQGSWSCCCGYHWPARRGTHYSTKRAYQHQFHPSDRLQCGGKLHKFIVPFFTTTTFVISVLEVNLAGNHWHVC